MTYPTETVKLCGSLHYAAEAEVKNWELQTNSFRWAKLEMYLALPSTLKVLLILQNLETTPEVTLSQIHSH